MKQWNILFAIGAAVYVFGGIVFILGVDSNAETWGRASSHSDSMVQKSKCDYQFEKSSSTNQVNIDINNNHCSENANTALHR